MHTVDPTTLVAVWMGLFILVVALIGTAIVWLLEQAGIQGW